MKTVAMALFLVFSATGCVTVINDPIVAPDNLYKPPKLSLDPRMLVGTPACPKLNAHQGQACRFARHDHGFQVWPDRISIRATFQPGIWLVSGTGHKDLMFDHTLRWAKDDHIAFQCYIRPADGEYVGPFELTIARGGTAKTYGTAITGGATGVGGYLGGPFGGAAGNTASRYVLEDLLTGDKRTREWAPHAHALAQDICEFLAAKAMMNR